MYNQYSNNNMIDTFYNILLIASSLCIVILLSEFNIKITIRKYSHEERKKLLESLKNKK